MFQYKPFEVEKSNREKWREEGGIHVWVFPGGFISKYRYKSKPQSPFIGSGCSEALIVMSSRAVFRACIPKWLCVSIH